MKRLAILLVLLAVAVGFWFYTHSDTARIKGLFRDIERIASRESSETVMEGALRAQTLGSFVLDKCRFSIPELAISTVLSRDDFAGSVLAYRSGVRVLSVRFKDLEIESDSGRATVVGILDLSGSDFEGATAGASERTFSCVLVEDEDGKWRFSQVSLNPERRE